MNEGQENEFVWDKCRVWSEEGIAFNVHQCIDEKGRTATCHNNCKGVDPSAIIGAGVAAVTLTALTGTSVLPAIGGAVGLGGVGAVGFMEMLRQQQQCTRTQCRVRYKLLLSSSKSKCIKCSFFRGEENVAICSSEEADHFVHEFAEE